MIEAAPHPFEDDRLAELRALGLLDSAAELSFDGITELVSSMLGVPISLISLVDQNRQWFLSCVGLDDSETGRSESFCAHAILTADDPFIVEDTLEDARFRDNPLVTGPPYIRMYAGVPIFSPSTRLPLGTLCAIDTTPRVVTGTEVEQLTLLARQVEELIGIRSHQQQIEELTRTLFAERSRFESAIETGTVAVLERNLDTDETWASSNFERVVGYDPQDFMSKWPNDERIHPDDVAWLRDELKRWYLGSTDGTVREFTYRVIQSDGSVRFIHSRSAVQERYGERVRIGINYDVTDHRLREQALQRLNEELQVTNASLEGFTRLASHDLRSPARSIRSLVGFIREDYGEQLGGAEDDLERIDARAANMLALIDDQLDYARAAPKQREERETTDLGAEIRAIGDSLDVPKGIRTVVAGDIEPVDIERVPLLTCVRNLIDNAVKHHPGPSGCITTTVSRMGGDLIVDVTDDGAGIEAGYIDEIFDPFRRLNADTPGDGVGLSMVRRLIDRHGAVISVQSEPGEGSTFSIRWPLVPDRLADLGT